MGILEKFKYLFISKEEVMRRDAQMAAELEKSYRSWRSLTSLIGIRS